MSERNTRMADATGYPSLDALQARLEAISHLSLEELEAEAIALLGRKGGILSAEARRIPTLPVDERKRFGAAVNQIKVRCEEELQRRRAELSAEAAPGAEFDLTMPGRERWSGGLHPVTRVMRELTDIFRGLGFSVATGPEVESEWMNFRALNFPPDHPAMDMHDTLYLAGSATGEPETRLLLRTHTTPIQVRTMQEGPPPYRVVMPGMVYRKDPFDASHAPAFAQLDGFAVDEGIGFVDLKATLTHVAHRFFGPGVAVRFRPSYFPFTEPSAEMDVRCQLCGGKGCAACKGTGWMEILGCGMVHPRVLEHGGVDPERFTGWAFGMGPGRIAMNRFGIPDIRLLYEGDMRFLSQFG